MSLNDWGGISSIVGLIASLIGFVLTLKNVKKSREAAEAATNAATLLRTELHRTNTVADVSTAIAFMEEIKRLHRSEKFELLPDRYSSLRRSLIAIRSVNPILSREDKAVFQDAIAQLSSFEQGVERHLAGKGNPIDVPRTNRAVSKTIDSLGELVTRLKVTAGN